MHDDCLAYVKEEADPEWNPPKYEMASGTVPFGSTQDQIEAVIESADECPGECIFIEVD